MKALRALAALTLALGLVAAPSAAQDGHGRVAAPTTAAPAEPDAARDRAAVEGLQASIQAAIARVRPAYCVVLGGSGVVITPDGWTLTNHHVVSTVPIGTRLRVQMPGTPSHHAARRWATLVGHDVLGDIALLKIDAGAEALPHAPLGDSEAVAVGQHVIALGNPFSYAMTSGEPTVTIGIVSAVHRYEDGYSDCIQTDAPLNPGNSGGPLLALDGTVVGINGRVGVRFSNRISTGVGYAIPAAQIRAFLPKLQAGGPTWHGTIRGLTVDGAHTARHGARVTGVEPNSSADFAGFQVGDVVLRAGERDVWNADRLKGILGTYPAEAEVAFEVERGGGARVTLRCWLDSLEPGAGSPNSPWLGLVPGEYDGADGCAVDAVRDGSPAAMAGIRGGDRVLKIGERLIRSGPDLGDALSGIRPDATVPVAVRRADGRNETVTVQLRPRGGR
jgi:S1-C subfamily serine protease